MPPVGWREPLFSSASGVEGLLGTSSFTKNSINTLKIWAVNILLTVVLLQTPLTGALFVFCVNHCFLLSTEPETVMR